MCSIRNHSAATTLLALIVLLGAGGCQFARNEAPKMNLNQSPLIADEAMQRRDWDRSPANYANGDPLAGPDLVVLEPAGPDLVQRASDPMTALVNAIISPVTTVITPPWKDMVY